MWACKKCGHEITAEVTPNISHIFDLDENGNPKNYLEEHLYNNIEECIKDNLDGAKIIYGCNSCSKFSADLEDIADWEE